MGEDEDIDEIVDCGMTEDGFCQLAGTEWCDWHCPYSDLYPPPDPDP